MDPATLRAVEALCAWELEYSGAVKAGAPLADLAAIRDGLWRVASFRDSSIYPALLMHMRPADDSVKEVLTHIALARRDTVMLNCLAERDLLCLNYHQIVPAVATSELTHAAAYRELCAAAAGVRAPVLGDLAPAMAMVPIVGASADVEGGTVSLMFRVGPEQLRRLVEIINGVLGIHDEN
jgi:hypothetical protein